MFEADHIQTVLKSVLNQSSYHTCLQITVAVLLGDKIKDAARAAYKGGRSLHAEVDNDDDDDEIVLVYGQQGTRSI